MDSSVQNTNTITKRKNKSHVGEDSAIYEQTKISSKHLSLVRGPRLLTRRDSTPIVSYPNHWTSKES